MQTCAGGHVRAVELLLESWHPCVGGFRRSQKPMSERPYLHAAETSSAPSSARGMDHGTWHPEGLQLPPPARIRGRSQLDPHCPCLLRFHLLLLHHAGSLHAAWSSGGGFSGPRAEPTSARRSPQLQKHLPPPSALHAIPAIS